MREVEARIRQMLDRELGALDYVEQYELLGILHDQFAVRLCRAA